MAKFGYAIVAVILVSGVFAFWQGYRVAHTLAVLRKLLPQQVKADGNVIQGLAAQLVPGDLVRLEQGDNLAAGCRLVEAFGVSVNTAAVTGVSLPKARATGAVRCGRSDQREEHRARRSGATDGSAAGRVAAETHSRS